MTDESRDPFPPEEEGRPEPERAEPEPALAEPAGPEPPRPAPLGTGIAWSVILLLFGIALVVVFSVQNTDPVPVKFLWMEGQFPFAIVILVTVGVIILLTELIGLSYRRRRRRRVAEREELRKYRGT